MVKEILIVIAAVFVIGIIVTCIQLGKMKKQNETANNTELGKKRLEELNRQGIEVIRHIYTEDETEADPSKAAAKLYYFPALSGRKSKFIVVCPGGAYAASALSGEGFPTAAKLNELGYTAFLLDYRCGKNGGNFAAEEDLAAAIRYITAHAQELNVEGEDYALLGYSAGGNLAGLFGTEENGYAKYEGIQKPSVLLLGYPWCNLNIRSFSPVKILLYAALNSVGCRGLIGKGASKEEKQKMRIPWQVTDQYPPCYIVHGTKDVFVPPATHSDVLAEALKKNGVSYQYEKAEGITHCFGIGDGTAAEGWVRRAVKFWEEQSSQQGADQNG